MVNRAASSAAAVGTVAAASTVAITVLLVLEGDPLAGIGFLYVLPTALVASRFGSLPGLVMAGVSFALFCGWTVVDDIDLVPLGFALRALGFVATALIVGGHVQRLRALSDAHSALIESAPDAIVRVDPGGRVTLANQRTIELFDWALEELHGMPAETLMPHWYEGGPVSGRRRDGSAFPVEITIAPSSEGSVTAIIRDVTSRMRTEEELKRSSLELTRSNEELQQFASVASHDLSEPLRVVAGFMELLRQQFGERLDPDALRYVDGAISGTDRMQSLLDALLVYSKVGGTEVARAPVEASLVVGHAIGALGNVIEETGADIEVAVLPRVSSDEALIGQLFQNLISNALKFQGDATPRVSISSEDSRAEWTFTVADNGVGIESKDAERIFLPFERLHGRDTPGTGMGLAVCQRIVEKHGGRIWVERSDLGGSAMRFTIPKAPAEPFEKHTARERVGALTGAS